MPNQASARLIRLCPKIMQNWETRSIAEIAASTQQNSLALQNSLPEFLNLLASALSTKIDRTQIRIKWDRDENARLGRKHGRERAETANYTMDQLIFEYHILRQVICEVMEEEVLLSPTEREVIVCAVEQAVNDAATQYSDTFTDIREKFTNTLAHDMRSPITATKLSAQILLRRPADAEVAFKIATRISTSMDRLDLMIHDLLDASRLRTGEKIDLQFEDCDLNQILQTIVDDTNFLHGQRLTFHPMGETRGQWDELGLHRIFDNLVTNALKFSSPDTPIFLELKKNAQHVEVTVQNFGNPIPPAEQSILFQQFRRSQNAKGKSGWGLGLTVVKGITEAHHGQVTVESDAATGTIFKITLPWSSLD
jgi:signal transduction histidine kinase